MTQTATEIQHGTAIEWTHFPGYVGDTWNPVAGCSPAKGSEQGGCKKCYAMRQRHRFDKRLRKGGAPFTILTSQGPKWTGRVELQEHKLTEPLRRRKPTCWFVNSMSDLFHEKLPDAAIDRVFAVMALCPQHLFIVLTKRAERMAEYCHAPWVRMVEQMCILHCGQIYGKRWPLPNVILGVSVENPETLYRIDHLLRTPAACRMISLEPQLADVDLAPYLAGYGVAGQCRDIDGNWWHEPGSCGGCRPGLDWVVQGGESGRDARPFDLAWARRTKMQCEAAGVRWFFKQAGAHVIQDGERRIKRDRKGGDMHEWPHDLRVRQFPEVAAHAD